MALTIDLKYYKGSHRSLAALYATDTGKWQFDIRYRNGLRRSVSFVGTFAEASAQALAHGQAAKPKADYIALSA